MVRNTANICAFGWKARDFALKAVDGKTYSLADTRGPKGTLVIFICNHCPYVEASIDRIVAEAKRYRKRHRRGRPRCLQHQSRMLAGTYSRQMKGWRRPDADLKTKLPPWAVRSSGILGRGRKEAFEVIHQRTGTQLLGENHEETP